MIDRVLQRPFVLWQAEALVEGGGGEPEVPFPEGASEISEAEVTEARAAIATALARERERPLSPPPARSDDSRGEEARSLDLLAYLPRDPTLSLVQSGVERYLLEHASHLLERAGATDEERRGGAEPPPIADYVLRIPDSAIPSESASDRRLGGAFELTDPRWISVVVAIGRRRLLGRHRFVDAPAPPRRLADDARVIVFGDWATGIDRARRVAGQIRKALDAPQAKGRECHVIHLGDTYYAGWDDEYRDRFLPHWPVKAGDPHGSWSLNGNHDMYTGGHGYFEVLLAEERFAPYHQGSSWFSLENEHWQLLGLDTAWEDHDLNGSQAAWVDTRLAEGSGRRTMLLSHHQLLSAYGSGGPKLKSRLAQALASGRVNAWLWGHEHRCVVYEPGEGVRAPRCLGHGGVPVHADHSRPPAVRWHLEASYRHWWEEWALCGFAVLDFDGPEVSVEYVNEYGGVDYTEML